MVARKNIPKHQLRLTSAREVMVIVESACQGSFEHDDPESLQQTELFAEFLQEAQDWAELSADLEAGDRVSASFRMNTLFQKLEQAGFWGFGSREIQQLEGGKVPPLAWPVSMIRITGASNPEIIRLTSIAT